MKRSEAMAKCVVEEILDGVTARYRHHQEALPDFDLLLGPAVFGVLEVVMATSSMHEEIHAVIRDDRAEAERCFRAAFDRNRVARPWENQPVGTPEDVAEKLAPYVALGYRHLIAGFPADYDEESMTRFATEVKPLLEKMA